MSRLLFIPSTERDSKIFELMIDKLGFYAEKNETENYFSFEELEECIDSLEIELTKTIALFDINGHFEIDIDV